MRLNNKLARIVDNIHAAHSNNPQSYANMCHHVEHDILPKIEHITRELKTLASREPAAQREYAAIQKTLSQAREF